MDVCCCYLSQLNAQSQWNRSEQNLYVLTPRLLPWAPDWAPKMWRICPQVPLLWLGLLFWWGALFFPKKSSSFSVVTAIYASNVALLTQIWAASWEVLSSCFGSGVEEERKPASHILLTAFPFTDVFSHTAQRSRSGTFENVWSKCSFSFTIKINKGVSWSRAAEVFCVLQCQAVVAAA